MSLSGILRLPAAAQARQVNSSLSRNRLHDHQQADGRCTSLTGHRQSSADASARECFLLLTQGGPPPVAEVDLRPSEASKAGGALHNQDPPPDSSKRQPFIMDKFVLRQQVLERLAEDLLQADQAVRAAHEAATHEQNIAENKYDTLGLEAAYLATGQARRAEAIRQAMASWRRFRPSPYDAGKGIQLGAIVCLVNSDDKQQKLFLGPDGGSMKLVSGAQLVQVVSCEAPLGRAVLGKREVMRCRYRSLPSDSSLRCCDFIEPQATCRPMPSTPASAP